MSTPAAIPNKRYFTIGEVSTLCAVKPHVLRYWEQEFQMLRPSKRRGNRRYYRYEDVMVVKQIKSLLYEQGYTISGARQQLITVGDAYTVPCEPAQIQQTHSIQNTLEELEEVLKILAS